MRHVEGAASPHRHVERAANALRAVLPGDASVSDARGVGVDRDLIVTVAGHDLRLRWLPVGWPRQVDEALRQRPRPQLLAAPHMSPGAREKATREDVGWVDETGAARISLPYVQVRLDGVPVKRHDPNLGWRPATLAVGEALLSGRAEATVSSIVASTGLAMSTAAGALKLLEREGHLTSDAARGRESGRRLSDRDALLDAYAAAASRLRSPIAIHVGALWRDPVAGAIDAGRHWMRDGLEWAATSALSAAVLAPTQTEIAPIEIYLPARTASDLRSCAVSAGLREMAGGRLLLRPFPTPSAATLTVTVANGLRSMLWPRVYADLRTAGVRGEDAAEHLREEMTR